MRGRIFDTPKRVLFFAGCRTQQCTIAATHQGKTALDQANGPIAQVVSLPITFGNASGAEQDFCYFPVGTAVGPGIERAQGKREPAPTMRGKRMQRRPWRPAIEGSPQPPACIRAEFKVTIEREFDCIDAGNDRRFLEPNAMFYLVQMHYCVPAVRALPQLTFGQVAEIQGDTRLCDREGYGPHRNDRRQNFRRPENSLFEAGLVGVSCEKTSPNAGGIPGLPWEAPWKRCDNQLQSRDYGVGIPTLVQWFPPLERDHRRLAISNRILTFRVPRTARLKRDKPDQQRLRKSLILHRVMQWIELRN